MNLWPGVDSRKTSRHRESSSVAPVPFQYLSLGLCLRGSPPGVTLEGFMNYYPHHIGDFNNATRHLTRVERSLYRDAIEHYYDTESPLPADDFDRLARRLMAFTQEEKEALAFILDEFFELTGDVYTHDRCDHEIDKFHATTTAKSRAGKASAEARRKNAEAKKRERQRRKEQKQTHDEHVLNSVSTEGEQNPTNQEPGTINQEPVKTEPENKFSGEDLKCAEWLFDKLRQFIPDCQKRNMKTWAKHVRDMRHIEGRSHEEICRLWLWCRNDSFEAANVQSPEKLRKRYDQLKVKMNKSGLAAEAGTRDRTLTEDLTDRSWADQ